MPRQQASSRFVTPREIVLVVAGIGGEIENPVCLARVNEHDSGSLAISYESDITGRTLTCIAKATDAQTV